MNHSLGYEELSYEAEEKEPHDSDPVPHSSPGSPRGSTGWSVDPKR